MNTSRENASILAAGVLRIASCGYYTRLTTHPNHYRMPVVPFLAIDWNRRILTPIRGTRLHNFMALVRISVLPNDIYVKIRSATNFREFGEFQFAPSELEERRWVIVRVGLDS